MIVGLPYLDFALASLLQHKPLVFITFFGKDTLLRRQYHLSLLQAFQREFPHVPECKGIPDKYRFLYKNLSNLHQYILHTHFSSHFQPSTPNRPEAFRAICTETFPDESARYHKMQFATE